MTQATIDFNAPVDYVSRRQNSKENQAILESVKPKLNRQCRVLLDNLQRGNRLTVGMGVKGLWDKEAGEYLVIGDLRARVRDLVKAGYDIKKEIMQGGFKSYWL